MVKTLVLNNSCTLVSLYDRPVQEVRQTPLEQRRAISDARETVLRPRRRKIGDQRRLKGHHTFGSLQRQHFDVIRMTGHRDILDHEANIRIMMVLTILCILVIDHDLRPSADGTGALLAGTGAEDMLGIISHTRYKNNPRSTNTATTSAMTAWIGPGSPGYGSSRSSHPLPRVVSRRTPSTRVHRGGCGLRATVARYSRHLSAFFTSWRG